MLRTKCNGASLSHFMFTISNGVTRYALPPPHQNLYVYRYHLLSNTVFSKILFLMIVIFLLDLIFVSHSDLLFVHLKMSFFFCHRSI